jgi:hypothetical protein
MIATALLGFFLAAAAAPLRIFTWRTQELGHLFGKVGIALFQVVSKAAF